MRVLLAFDIFNGFLTAPAASDIAAPAPFRKPRSFSPRIPAGSLKPKPWPTPPPRPASAPFPDVGEKIADCVRHFGAGRLEAFPVDPWILHAFVRRHGLADKKPAPVAPFDRAHFGPLAGFAQQFLFTYERAARS